jgi:hypothetical protein
MINTLACCSCDEFPGMPASLRFCPCILLGNKLPTLCDDKHCTHAPLIRIRLPTHLLGRLIPKAPMGECTCIAESWGLSFVA